MALEPAAASIRGRLKADEMAVLVYPEHPSPASTTSINSEKKSDATSEDVKSASKTKAGSKHSDGFWLSASPEHADTSGKSCLQVLQDLTKALNYQNMSERLQVHVPVLVKESFVYSLPIADSDSSQQQTVAEIVTKLVKLKCFPGADQFYPISDCNELSALLSAQYVCASIANRRKFQLTQHGLTSILIVRKYQHGKPVANVLLQETSLHNKLQELEEQGWQWEPLCRKRKLQDPGNRGYEIDVDPKVWRTSSSVVSLDYVQCLLNASQLKRDFSITYIPHGAPAKVYSNLLVGKMPANPKPACALEHDISRPQDIQQLAEDPDPTQESMQYCVTGVADAEAPEESLAALQDMPGKVEGSIVELEIQPQPSTQPAVSDALPPPPIPLANENPARSRCNRKKPQVDENKQGGGLDWSTFRWGGFLFTAKKPKNEGGQFAWQAGCPFHMRNAKTGCKKSMNVNPVTVENYKRVLTCLKHWCNQATQFTHQRLHLGYNVSPACCPDESLVEAACIPACEKPNTVVSDLEKDKQSAKQKIPQSKAKAKKKTQMRPVPSQASSSSDSSSNQLEDNSSSSETSSDSSSTESSSSDS